MDLLEKSESAIRHPWELARFEVVKDILANNQISYDGKHILDLGCGDLFFIEKFSNDKPNAKFYAVDIAFTQDFIDAHSDSKIHIANSLDQLAVDQNLQFDIIFLMDVIEHIEDDITFLQDLLSKPYITNNSIFVITVPAYQKLFSSHDVFLKHYKRYTNNSIKKVLEQAGMMALDNGYFFLSLLAPRSLEVLKEKFLKQDIHSKGTGLTKWKHGSFITNLLKNILLTDYKIQKILKKTGIRIPGLSNYILCKKPV